MRIHKGFRKSYLGSRAMDVDIVFVELKGKAIGDLTTETKHEIND
jgi:hypothetical protein